MKTRSFPLLGLLVGAALIASFAAKPAAACDHTRYFFNIFTGCCGCKYNPNNHVTCTINDCNDCPTVQCPPIRSGAAQGTLLPAASLQCSLGDDAWSRLAGSAAGVQVEVVKLKARS
jgi:hypothetical protein